MRHVAPLDPPGTRWRQADDSAAGVLFSFPAGFVGAVAVAAGLLLLNEVFLTRVGEAVGLGVGDWSGVVPFR
ncbi:hypothetical protein EYF80_031658 [Liparis tanakae]|uniref:Uncharacterized protein n=1 Tax=Liparis tanakae TaxID=230148 RepID=A0A4Z2GYF4_9TELE|nr:hypothetical protein EYF80_031658 [Liparis tanakae]